jgi:hypothetical protein
VADREGVVSDYLSADELADLVGCRPNQRSVMGKWLSDRRWRFVLDRNQFPKVARSYYRKKLGLEDDGPSQAFATGPNLEIRRHA